MREEMEIIRAACGLDENGETKSVVRVEAKILSLSGEGSEEPVSDMTLDNPCVNIHKSFRYTMVDLEFSDSADEEYAKLTNMLKDFTVPERSMDLEEDLIPALVLTILPKEFEGEYFICGMHGTWCLMPSAPDRPVDTVRFLFENELIHTFKLDDDAISSYEEDFDDEPYLMGEEKPDINHADEEFLSDKGREDAVDEEE